MKYFKSLFSSKLSWSNLEILLVVIFSLFFVASPMILMVGDPFMFGAKNEALGLYFPLVGLTFFGLTVLNLLQKSWTKISTSTLIGLGIILLAIVINGYFSAEPKFNFYLLGWVIFCGLSCVWKPLEIKNEVLALIMLIGLMLGTIKSLTEVELSNLVAPAWALWFWFFTRKKSANQKIVFLLTLGFFISFEYWVLAFVVSLIGIIDWWKQKKLYRRKSAPLWGIVFLGLFGTGIFTLFKVLQNFVLPQALSWSGVGIFQWIPTLNQNSLSVFIDASVQNNGFSVFMFEWGMAGILLGIGFYFLWQLQKEKISLWALFLATLATSPGIIDQPIFWLMLSFFTFSLERLRSEP